MTDLAQDSGRQSRLLAMQVDALYKGAPASLMSIFGGILVLLTYLSPQLETFLWFWFGCVCFVAISHLISAVLHDRNRFLYWSPLAWSRLLRVIYFSSGACWGLGGSWLLQQGTDHQTLVICCIAMGAVTVTFPAVVYRPAFNLFQMPIFSAFAVSLALSGLQYGHLLSIASVMLCVALAVIAHAMGAQMTHAFRLSEENRQLVETLKERGTILEEANRELTAQTLTDPLTGLANRRRLMEFLRRVSGRCAILVIDVDHFKSYNDSYGHGEGDACLVLVAGALPRSIQPAADLASRHGGEEFVVVLTELSLERALDVAELIRQNIQALNTAHPQRVRRLVTASIGLAYRDDALARNNNDLLADADMALYAAKNSGRNRVAMLTGGRTAAAE